MAKYVQCASTLIVDTYFTLLGNSVCLQGRS